MSAIFDNLALGFGVAFSPLNLLVAAIGAFFGTIVGVLPGLGPINGVAMLIPIAYAMNLPPETALILLAAVYVGAEYGGRITSILINVPGEAASIMTTLDGYPLARQGLGSVALSLSAWASFVGSFIAFVGIVVFAPMLAGWALTFGPPEYFVLMVFAFCCLTSLLGQQPVKGVLAAMIGLGISTVGVDSNSGVYRYTFDSPNLADGIDFVVVVIALFAISEMLEMLEHVPDPAAIVRACATLVKPGGQVFFSTLNRNPKAFLYAIVGAEYLLKLLPKGTHHYDGFLKPSELATYARQAGLEVVGVKGLTYQPLTRRYTLTGDVSVNYMMATKKLLTPRSGGLEKAADKTTTPI